jgi:hypothetical protein
VGALRVVRWSERYDETVTFYRDAIGLPVLETFHDSYGLDGTILGLPGGQVHLEIVRAVYVQISWNTAYRFPSFPASFSFPKSSYFDPPGMERRPSCGKPGGMRRWARSP